MPELHENAIPPEQADADDRTGKDYDEETALDLRPEALPEEPTDVPAKDAGPPPEGD